MVGTYSKEKVKSKKAKKVTTRRCDGVTTDLKIRFLSAPLRLCSKHFCLLTFAFCLLLLSSCQKQKTFPIWVWSGGIKDTSVHYWDSAFRVLHDAGITGILVHSGKEKLEKIIPVAKKYDIEIHAWIWTMNRGDADSSWLSVNRLGKSLAEEKAYVGYYKFMCPALPEVREFISDKLEELAETKGLSGIHMDYIRYVDAILPVGLQPKYGLVQDHIMPEFDYGYHPYMCELFEKEYGIDPFDINDPKLYQQWVEFKLYELNKTVWMLRDQVRNDGIKISAAVFPTPEMSKEMVRQDWASWDLDYYFPMVYHNFYNESFEWIREVMKENRAAIPGNKKIFCGLYLPALKEGEDLKKAINAAMEGGADGIALFSLGSLNTDLIKQISK